MTTTRLMTTNSAVNSALSAVLPNNSAVLPEELQTPLALSDEEIKLVAGGFAQLIAVTAF